LLQCTGRGAAYRETTPRPAIWYRKAADRGDVQAQERMVVIYREGKGVAADKVEAEKWLMRSHGNHL
jgi:TPR repeat protein